MQQETRKIFTLTALNKALEKKFLEDFGSTSFWVTAEITKIDQKGGNYYLQLADSKENITTALISAHIWSAQFRFIQQQVGEELLTILKSGNRVLFQVKIEFHAVYGLKLSIQNIDPSYSHGEIERRKQETIRKLKSEGLFDLQKALYFPVISKRIALVGSPQTSGFRDFKDELFNNTVYRRFKLKEFHTSVQGDRAVEEIIKAIEKARCYDVDVIVLIRGGGSKMDLDVFNHFALCKTICETKIPIITGIGHETDQVVADLVAKQFFITPTAVAKHLYVQIGNFRHFLSKYYDTIQNRALDQLGGAKDEFNHLNKYLVHHSQNLVTSWKEQVKDAAYKLSQTTLHFIHQERVELNDLRYQTHVALRNTLRLVDNELTLVLNQVLHKSIQLKSFHEDGSLTALSNKLHSTVFHLLEQEKVKLANKEELVHLLNPEKILQSGYTISTIDNQDLIDFKGEMEGRELLTLTATALVKSKIIEYEKISYGKK